MPCFLISPTRGSESIKSREWKGTGSILLSTSMESFIRRTRSSRRSFEKSDDTIATSMSLQFSGMISGVRTKQVCQFDRYPLCFSLRINVLNFVLRLHYRFEPFNNLSISLSILLAYIVSYIYTKAAFFIRVSWFQIEGSNNYQSFFLRQGDITMPALLSESYQIVNLRRMFILSFLIHK